jgi:chemotaxis protein methyltransferase CheR
MDAVADLMQLVYDVAGIHLTADKRTLVESRLGKRLRELGADMAAYALRCRNDPAELTILLDLVTTNHTAWLREPAHFTDFRERVLVEHARTQGAESRPRLRVWCAAAATGEEPYTIAMSICRALPDLSRWDAAILATDISTRALAHASMGIYSTERIAPLSPDERNLAVEAVNRGGHTLWQVRDHVRQLVHFARLNLMGPWPMRGPFDVIFCRNVMIYFDQPTQERLVQRMATLLRPGGTLYIGHSESLSACKHPLTALAPAVYAA